MQDLDQRSTQQLAQILLGGYTPAELNSAVRATAPPPSMHVLSEDGTFVPFHPGQLRVWQSERRVTAMLAGTQGGKTALGPWWLRRAIKTYGPGDYYAVTATFDLFKLKMLPEMLRVFDQQGQGRYWGNDRIIELADPQTGLFLAKKSTDRMWGRIILRSAESKGGLESGTAKAAWLDEAGQDRFGLEAWRAIRRRLSLHRGPVLMTTTLYNLGWLKQQIIDPAKDGGTAFQEKLSNGAELEVTDNPGVDIRLVQFDSIVNPTFSLAEYLDAQGKMPASDFAMFYRGRVARLQTLIYDIFDEEIHVVAPFPIPPSWPRAVGVDPKGAQTAAIGIALDPEKAQVHVYREYLAPFGETTGGHVANVLDLFRGENVGIWAGGGPSERQERTDWTGAGIQLFDPPAVGVWPGILRVYELLKTYALVVHKCCGNLISEFGTYQRKRDQAGNFTEEIKDKQLYHCLDALRYIIVFVTQPIPEIGVKYANFPRVDLGY